MGFDANLLSKLLRTILTDGVVVKFILSRCTFCSCSMSDIVATWDVSLSDGVHKVNFEHGTTTGKRVITVDGVEILRKNWMFRLVGQEYFKISGKKASIHVDAISGFQYEYTLEVDGKPLRKFVENRKKTSKVWTLLLGGNETRIVLGKSNYKNN